MACMQQTYRTVRHSKEPLAPRGRNIANRMREAHTPAPPGFHQRDLDVRLSELFRLRCLLSKNHATLEALRSFSIAPSESDHAMALQLDNPGADELDSGRCYIFHTQLTISAWPCGLACPHFSLQ